MIKIYLESKLDFNYNADNLLAALTYSLFNLKIIETEIINYIEIIKLLGSKHDHLISKDHNYIYGGIDIEIYSESLIKSNLILAEDLNFIIKDLDLPFTYSISINNVVIYQNK